MWSTGIEEEEHGRDGDSYYEVMGSEKGLELKMRKRAIWKHLKEQLLRPRFLDLENSKQK